VGEYVNVPCIAPWDACGMIRTDMVGNRVNDIMDSGTWLYRVYVFGEGSRSEQWTGVLIHDDADIPPGPTPIDTPMGSFRPVSRPESGGAYAGWFPVSWKESMSPAG